MMHHNEIKFNLQINRGAEYSNVYYSVLELWSEHVFPQTRLVWERYHLVDEPKDVSEINFLYTDADYVVLPKNWEFLRP